jgi:uncharacterized repeat protein (TIGR03806 family)
MRFAWRFIFACIACRLVGELLFTAEADDDVATTARPRTPWNTSRVTGFPDPPPPFTTRPVYANLAIKYPLAIGRFPHGDLMWMITHRTERGGPGQVHLFRDHPDVSSRELLIEVPEVIYGLAFPPRFATNRYIYIGCNGYSTTLDAMATRVLRFTVSRDPPFRCDPDSQTLIIEWPSDGHNGGDVDFGPDGMLYVSAGDGTSDSDTDDVAQDLGTLTGSILRIDVDRPSDGRMYSIPADNPFVDLPNARPEIWAYGLRNPWRISYDHSDDQLWAGNNGQDLWETAHLVRRGENYGWSVMEGNHPFQLERRRGPTEFVPPTIEHPHSEARSLTGGVVYRGDALPELEGAYIYGDYATGDIWAARHDGSRLAWHMPLARTKMKISGFGLNHQGEVLVVDHGGRIATLVRQGRRENPPDFPRLLSQTGIFADVALHLPQDGLIPYEVNAPLWSDGATKTRLIGLPGDAQIEFRGQDAWVFPEGTVLVKTFFLPINSPLGVREHRVETRLLVRQDGEWAGYSYEWNEQQTDAILVTAAGKAREFVVAEGFADDPKIQTWYYPSRSECMVCHSRAADFVLGFTTRQLNRPYDYGNGPINQLLALQHLGVFKAPPPSDTAAPDSTEFQLPRSPTELPRLANPYDATQPLADRVRAYFDVNCANCHVEAGGGNSLMDLGFYIDWHEMRIIDATPQHDRLGIKNPRLIAPGDPDRSILLERMRRRGRAQMPPLATSQIDKEAVALIREWILSLNDDPDRDHQNAPRD